MRGGEFPPPPPPLYPPLYKLVFVFSFPQIKRMYKQKQYATEIKAALDLVKSYQEANTKLQLEKEEELKQYTTSKLKQKGHQPLQLQIIYFSFYLLFLSLRNKFLTNLGKRMKKIKIVECRSNPVVYVSIFLQFLTKIDIQFIFTILFGMI